MKETWTKENKELFEDKLVKQLKKFGFKTIKQNKDEFKETSSLYLPFNRALVIKNGFISKETDPKVVELLAIDVSEDIKKDWESKSFIKTKDIYYTIFFKKQEENNIVVVGIIHYGKNTEKFLEKHSKPEKVVKKHKKIKK